MGSRKILVVDDELHVVSVLTTKFRQQGDAVLRATDGEEALKLARQELPDVIVSDYQMPKLNGVELAGRLRADAATAHIPIVVLTGCGHRLGPSELAVQTNIRILMDKPFSSRELLARIEELMETRPVG
jgi:CheY-like chemotaxis protein